MTYWIVAGSPVPDEFAEAAWRYSGPVLGQPRLPDLTSAFEGWTVR